MTSDSAPERKFWQVALADLEQQLATGRNGLTSAEAATRRLRYGPNTLEARRRLSLPLKFLCRFRNPLVIILLVAAAISALTGDLTSFIIISTIVLMSAVLDTVQEYRAEEAAEALKVSVALKERVLRDGQEVTVLGQDLVPGDVVLLGAGDLVPADGRLIESRDFFVNEALLTGESYPAEKYACDEGVQTEEIAAATNAAFMGSSVMNGSACLVVCGTGLATQLGQISSTLRRAPPPTALEQGTRRFGMLIVRLTEILVLFVTAVRIRRPLDHRSRAKRWRDAVSELTTLQGQYAAWLGALPENLQDSATAEALQAICDLDLTELQAIVPPRGFGRDRPARRPLGTRAGASRTAPDRPTSPAPHRTALAPAAQPRPAPPGRALPPAPFTRGVNFGRRSGVTFRRRLTVWPPGAEPLPPQPWSGRGRPPSRMRRDGEHVPVSAKTLARTLPEEAWRIVPWREGSNRTSPFRPHGDN